MWLNPSLKQRDDEGLFSITNPILFLHDFVPDNHDK